MPTMFSLLPLILPLLDIYGTQALTTYGNKHNSTVEEQRVIGHACGVRHSLVGLIDPGYMKLTARTPCSINCGQLYQAVYFFIS
jgi:hypothetical protein